MNKLRILFMGTPEFAVTILSEIIAKGYEVVGVVTAPDKPAGRGRKLSESAVKKFANQHQLEVLQPTNLKSDTFQEDLKRLSPNLQVVVAFRMLPKKVWQFPEYGTFNLHASLLPQYRGAAPINWAIINGEEKTGVSTFFIDEKIDTGAIILQDEIAIGKDTSAGELHDQLMHLGAKTVIKTLGLIEANQVDQKIQPQNKELKTAYKFTKENTKINWELGTQAIYNFIRGLSPFPSAWTILTNNGEQLTCKLYKARMQLEDHTYTIGKLVQENKCLKAATKDGFIFIDEIQLPGKRKMNTKDLLNGFTVYEDACMG